MASTDKIQRFGISKLWIRGSDGLDEQLKAIQDVSISIKTSLVELTGDDSLVPLAMAPNKLDLTVGGKAAQLSSKALQILNGGTLVTVAANTVTAVASESTCSNMATATTVVAGSGTMVTDTWLFTALTPTTYQVTKQSDGTVYGPYTTSASPNASIIPGCTVTVAVTPALTLGSTATVMTTGATGSIEHLTLTAVDYPGTCLVHCITENITGIGRYEFTMYKCQSEGNVFPMKHKDYSLTDFSFKVLWNETLDKTVRVKRLVDTVSC
jgi:hypothetical protein